MRFLSGVRKKIMTAFFLAFITLLAAGVVAFYSIEKIISTVDDIAVPDKSISLMYNIFGDLSLISNYNRIYSITNDYEYQAKIEEVAQRIRQKSDTLELLMRNQPLQRKQVDSLKILIENIFEDSKKLAKAKQNADMNGVTSRLTKQILDHVKTDSTLFRDSTYVLKTTTSEIKVSDFIVQQIDSLAKTTGDPKSLGFFQKLGFLFSGKRPSTLVDTLYLAPKKQIDTLTTVSKDSILLLSKGDFVKKLDSLLTKFSEAEKASLSQINNLELNFTRRNNELIEKARTIILMINQQTIQSTFTEINKASKISTDSKNLILFIILFFVVAGVVLASYVFMDLSKSSFYQEELFEAKKNAEQSAKAKLDFLAKMSHEIRSPLTSILGFAHLLNHKEDEYVKIIRNSCQQLLNTANEILDLAKVDNGIIDINKQPFDLKEFLKYLVMDFEMKVQNKGLRFVAEFPEEEKIIINSDEFRLQQIITNLMNNALKFTETGHVKFMVQRGMERSGTVDIRMTVEDTGSGIKPEDLNKIFEEFKQFGTVSTKKLGFGLGLSIVKKLVQQLGGTLAVKSIPKQGTRFNLHFTFEKAEITETLPAEPESSQAVLKGRKIVLVDDDPTILKLLSILLQKYQAQVVAFDNPESVVSYFSKETCDLCLMDIQLSGFSGIALCKELREYPSTKDLKIVAFTANLIENTKEGLLAAGFDDLILKPIFEKDLIANLARMLGIDEREDVEFFDSSNAEFPNQPALSKIDLREIEKFTFGDADLMNEVIDQFITETQKDFRSLESDAETFNVDGAAQTLHKLTSRLQQFGIKDLAEISKKTEIQIRKTGELPADDLQKFITAGLQFIEEARLQFA